MILKLLLISVILMAIVFLALGIRLLFDRDAKMAIGSCCSAEGDSSCLCADKTDCGKKS
jgi:hypothetical protein